MLSKLLLASSVATVIAGCSSLQPSYQLIRRPISSEDVIAEDLEPKQIKPNDIYALLCKASLDIQFSSTLGFVYTNLLEVGIPSQNIFLVGGEGKPESKIFSASPEGMKGACTELARTIPFGAVFFFYTTPHGWRDTNASLHSPSFLCFSKEQLLSEAEFELCMEPIVGRSSSSVLCFSQCYGGAFAHRFGKQYTISISKSGHNELSYCSPIRGEITHFEEGLAKYFVPALFGNVDKHKRNRIDRNHDRIISVIEAYRSAVKEDFRLQFTNGDVLFNNYHLYYHYVNPTHFSLDICGFTK